jgi:PAS domain S-box-containing protein
VSEPVRVLLVEDNPADVDLVREALHEVALVRFFVESAARLSDALARLEAGGIDLVLLDLGLPDSQGLDTFRTLQDAAPNVPVIVLTGNVDQSIGLGAVSEGAQDYLVKGEVTGNSLARSARHAIARRRADEALRASEERFRVAQEMSPDGFTILRPVRDAQDRVVDFTWVYENPTIARLNGTDPEAVVGQRLLELFPGHRGSQFLRAYQQVAESGESYTFEAEYSGESMPTPTWFRIVTVPMGGEIAILAQDITRQKEAEKALRESEGKFRTMTEQTADLIALTNADGVITYASAAAVSLFHSTPEQMCGRPFMEFLDESAIPNAAAAFRDAQSRGERTRDLALTMKRHDGSLFVGELNGSDFRSGTLSGTLVIIRDITERKQTEERLKSQLEELQRWEAIMLDREDRVREIKREVNELCRRVGEDIRYRSEEAQ